MITDIEVRVGVTKNIGNYESVRLDYSLREQLVPGGSATMALKLMREKLQELVKEDVNKVVMG